MLTTFMRSVSADPAIPAAWMVFQFVVSLVLVVLLVASLVSIVRTKNQPPARIVLWVLIVFLLPFIGPILWFIGGRKAPESIHSLPS